MSSTSSSKMIMILAVVVCFCLFLSSAATGGLFFYNKSKSSSSSSKPKSTSSNPPPFDGYITPFTEGSNLGQIGASGCNNHMVNYNKDPANASDRIVGYGVRSANHTGAIGNTCIFYKNSQKNGTKISTANSEMKVTSTLFETV